MILLTMGMMEVGRMVMVRQLLVNASREGARLAVLPGTGSQEVQTLVQEELQASSISGATVSVSPTLLASASAGTPVTVTVSVPSSAVSWVPNPLFNFSSILDASTTMRRESQ